MNLPESTTPAQLHQRICHGEQLTADELRVLQQWYEANDQAEDQLLNQSQPNALLELEAQLNRMLSAIEQTTRQNEELRRENETLRQAIENRLQEKAA